MKPVNDVMEIEKEKAPLSKVILDVDRHISNAYSLMTACDVLPTDKKFKTEKLRLKLLAKKELRAAKNITVMLSTITEDMERVSGICEIVKQVHTFNMGDHAEDEDMEDVE